MADGAYTVGVEFTTGSFTDVAPDCLKVNIVRDLFTFDRAPSEARCTFTLHNVDGKYSPANSASPLFGNLAIGNNVSISVTHSLTTYPLFTGRLTNVRNRPELGSQLAVFEAADDVSRLRRRTGVTSIFVNTNVGSILANVLSAASVSSFSLIGLTTDMISPAVFDEDETVINVLGSSIEHGMHAGLVDESGTVVVQHRDFLLRQVTSVATLTEFFALRYEIDIDSVKNKGRVSGGDRTASASYGVLAQIGSSPFIPASSAGRSPWINFTLVYTDPDGILGQVTGFDMQPTVPGSDYRMCKFPFDYFYDPCGVDLTSQCSVFVEYGAETAVVTVFNGSSISAYVHSLQIRGRWLESGATAQETFEVSSSSTQYGLRSVSFGSDLISNDDYAQQLAKFLAVTRKDPIEDFSFTLRNVLPLQYTARVGDRVSAVNSITGVNAQYIISETEHDIDLRRGSIHTTTYKTSRWVDHQFLILSSSADNSRIDFGNNLTI